MSKRKVAQARFRRCSGPPLHPNRKYWIVIRNLTREAYDLGVDPELFAEALQNAAMADPAGAREFLKGVSKGEVQVEIS